MGLPPESRGLPKEKKLGVESALMTTLFFNQNTILYSETGTQGGPLPSCSVCFIVILYLPVGIEPI